MFPRRCPQPGDIPPDRRYRAHIASRVLLSSMVSLAIPALITPGGCAFLLSGDLLDGGRSARGEETTNPWNNLPAAQRLR